MLRKVLAVLFTTSLITVCLAAQGKPTRPDNNLSVPVIWSDGVTTVLRGDPDLSDFSGDYWFWWPEGACLADSRTGTCKDKKVTPPADYEIVYPQQETSAWQAESLRLIPAVDPPLGVDWINWSDNLESIDQQLDLALSVSIVLGQNPGSQPAMNGFVMRHLAGLGADELWGTNTLVIDSYEPTVYSHCTRLTIQRFEADTQELAWNPWTGEWEGGGIHTALVNQPVWEDSDNRVPFRGAVNSKGVLWYEYIWDIRKLNEGAGSYRVTFSLDSIHCPATCNALFDEGTVIRPLYEADRSEAAGGEANLDLENQLTYIDIMVRERPTGGNGGS